MTDCRAKASGGKVVCRKCRYESGDAEPSCQNTCDKKSKAIKPHYHQTEKGRLVRCYHECKSLLTDYRLWISVTASFPVEHALWTKVWPFKLLAEWMGL